jgi:hypothetical protein
MKMLSVRHTYVIGPVELCRHVSYHREVARRRPSASVMVFIIGDE